METGIKSLKWGEEIRYQKSVPAHLYSLHAINLDALRSGSL